jgi:hypothetical protein
VGSFNIGSKFWIFKIKSCNFPKPSLKFQLFKVVIFNFPKVLTFWNWTFLIFKVECFNF